MITAGAESMPDYELLEMLLFAANSQGDVKPTAKALLVHFGGFGEVIFNASRSWILRLSIPRLKCALRYGRAPGVGHHRDPSQP
jgi:hypothetical protein